MAYKPQPIKEVARRIRAARGFKGLSRKQLAERIEAKYPSKRGLGSANLFRLETADFKNDLDEDQLQVIADICGVPLEFFYADLSAEALRTLTQPDPRAQVVSKLDEAAQRLRRPGDGTGEGMRDQSGEGPPR
jgi:transcriptional regulator with XRE-family HTH domain